MTTTADQSSIGTVGVVGLGTMGAGIAEVVAKSGYRVIAIESDHEMLKMAQARIKESIDRAVLREKITDAERDEILAALRFSVDLGQLADADLVIEAVPERLELKRELFAQLDDITRPDAILATNTSSLSVTDISVATSRPFRVVGIHFFNPAPVQAFVEIVRTVVSDAQVIANVTEFAQSLGKEPVVVGDRAGFIANALLFGYLNHAASMYEQQYASREDIDAAMKLGCGLPMGPLALLDLIGLDTAYEILDTMYKEGRDRLHAPTPILKHLVSAGLRGRKSGRGFYTYAAPGSSSVVPESGTQGVSHEQTGSARTIESVGVVGSGTMASGIVEVFARAGLPVIVHARTTERVEALTQRVTSSLDRAVAKGRLDEIERGHILTRISGSTQIQDLGSCDLVVEAVVEDVDVKMSLFRELDLALKPGAILATTTSSLPVIELAAVTSRPGDVVGLHFFNPAAVMKLVEVVHTVATDPEVTRTALALVERIGKHAVLCGDRAGFIVNALLFPYLNDAARMAEANYATPDDIDLAMKRGCGYPMGPFELMDVVGLDVTLAIQQTLYREFREPGFAPAPGLEHLVTAGFLGRKSGRGFRTYE
jgi:3-hydroxybutyryl-CoA dehydrogenase